MKRFAFWGIALWGGLALGAGAEPVDEEALGREAVALAQEYLRIDTTNPPGNETRGAEFLAALFEREGIEVQVLESAPGRGNVVARLRGDGSRPDVVLMHHIDVVPADPRYWQADPFGGEIRDGELWGRGALDTKALGITHAVAMFALKRQGAALGGDVIFLGVADEEAGGRFGAGFLVERHPELFEKAGVVLNEGGAIGVDESGTALFYGVEAAQKTPLWLRLTARGTPGHGSMPLAGSAPNRLLAALARLAEHETPLRVVPHVQEFYEATAHLAPPGQREVLGDLRRALRDPAFARGFTAGPRENAEVRSTISITVLEASNKTNVIPPQASAELDVRLLPDEEPEAFLAELRRVIADDSIEIETLLSFAPASSPIDHELFDVLRDVAGRWHPSAVVATPLAVGFTDCHYFRERGIPCYGFAAFAVGESQRKLIHGNDERIPIEDLERGASMTWEIVSALAGARP